MNRGSYARPRLGPCPPNGTSTGREAVDPAKEIWTRRSVETAAGSLECGRVVTENARATVERAYLRDPRIISEEGVEETADLEMMNPAAMVVVRGRNVPGGPGDRETRFSWGWGSPQPLCVCGSETEDWLPEAWRPRPPPADSFSDPHSGSGEMERPYRRAAPQMSEHILAQRGQSNEEGTQGLAVESGSEECDCEFAQQGKESETGGTGARSGA
ncbi:hypothetical protein NDU88_002560 [Pleurodeles waltl]|uniref:Uncharacterized protein n=1 Tax=Pleurodeles waltl TaxID=8319 RepID=A0AAV7M0Y1_PLEWA|nr:hypothetical protein NDU88_002560 [Pleurodeles waltl]